jgi:hypothetical protein
MAPHTRHYVTARDLTSDHHARLGSGIETVMMEDALSPPSSLSIFVNC